jgi:site-specific recombinase XerD
MILTHNSTTKSGTSNIPGAQADSQGATGNNYFELFLKSREAMGVSDRTLQFYKERLSKVLCKIDYINVTREQIRDILNSIPPNKYGLSTRHASYRALKAFYRWLSREYGITNPIDGLPAPILGKPILPTLTLAQVKELLEKSSNLRARAIISLLVESGLRLTELSNLRLHDIDFESQTVRVMGKGRKEAEAPFGPLTEQYLKAWLKKNKGKADTSGNIWGIKSYGIVSMLRRLEKTTGITCNPHTFRRTFAVLLRKAGVDTMTIQNLGRWESIAMVQRYTRSFTFRDSLRFYKAPLGQNTDVGRNHE